MKDSVLRLRIDKELKDKFMEKCKILNINPSELLRTLVKNFIDESKERK